MIRSGGPNSSANVQSSTSSSPAAAACQPDPPSRALIDPGDDRVDGFLGETPVRLEVLDADVRVIGVRRHLPLGHSLSDAARPRLDFLVSREPHGGDTTFPVADDAVLVDDGGDVAGVGRRRVNHPRTRRRSPGPAPQPGTQKPRPGAMAAAPIPLCIPMFFSLVGLTELQIHLPDRCRPRQGRYSDPPIGEGLELSPQILRPCP